MEESNDCLLDEMLEYRWWVVPVSVDISRDVAWFCVGLESSGSHLYIYIYIYINIYIYIYIYIYFFLPFSIKRFKVLLITFIA